MDENIRGALNGTILSMKRAQEKQEAMESQGCYEVPSSEWNDAPHTYAYSGGKFSLADIDLELSKEVQCRVETKVIAANVSLYATGIKSGNTLPAIVIYKYKGKWVVADGLHTLLAALSVGVTHVLGIYFVSHPQIEMVIPLFNLRNGQNVTEKEHIVLAAARAYNRREEECKLTGGRMLNRKEFAKAWLVDETKFNTKCRVLQAIAFLKLSGFDTESQALTLDTTLDKIGSIAEKQPEVAIDIATKVVELSLNGKDTAKLCDIFTTNNKGKTTPQRQQEFKDTVLELELNAPKRKFEDKTKVPRAANRPKEQIIRDSMVMIAENFPAADHDKFKEMMATDSTLKDAFRTIVKYCR